METFAEGVRSTRDRRPSRSFEVRDREGVTSEGRGIDRAIWAVVAFGILIRVLKFLIDRPLWGDEAMVAVNVLGRGFGGLLEPLVFFQVAPIGFLWIERAALVVLGASEWSLRLAPAVCGILAVPAFAWLSRRAIGPRAGLIAVTIFAVSYAPIRHSVEVKPYAFDLLAAVLILLPAVAWRGAPGASRRWLGSLIVVAPIMMVCSHPAVFVAGGVGLALLPEVWRRAVDRPRQGLRRIWLVYLGAVGLTFLGVFTLSTGDQSQAVGHVYRFGYWASAFPPLGEPWKLPGWLVSSHLGEAFGYPIGAARGGSIVSTLLAVIGLVSLIREGNRGLASLLIAPLGMTLAASFLGKYPYGGAARTMQHVAPTLCLLIAVGGVRLIDRVADPARRATHMKRAVVGLLAIGLVMLTIDLARPYRTVEDQRTRDFARWFWPEVSRGAEVGCSRAMRGTTFDGFYWRLGRLELYLANRALALPEGIDPSRPRLDRVSADRPLRIVVFNDDPRFDIGLASWLDAIGLCFSLREVRSYSVNGGIIDEGMGREERFYVFEYGPLVEDEESGGVPGLAAVSLGGRGGLPEVLDQE